MMLVAREQRKRLTATDKHDESLDVKRSPGKIEVGLVQSGGYF
jgi:hypothetical protein